jgi:pimeloyl-ACP methyl ester carboxylesterase
MSMNLSSFQFRDETEELNAETRKEAPGKFVELPNGYTHYDLAGSRAGRPVILVHGFSIPYYIWDPTFHALANAGIHIIRYDIFGRGFSDRPDEIYNLDLFVNQLYYLIKELGLNSPVDLIGLSMGGPISIAFCDRHPKSVRKLGLIDPAGVPMRSTVLGKLMLRPWIGEFVLNLIGNWVLLSQLTKDFKEPEKFPAFVEKAKRQMRFKGYKRALLSTLRHDALSNLSDIYQRIGQQERDSLLIWGIEDKLIPYKFSAIIRNAIPQITFFGIEDAGHIPHYERPEIVNPILLNFLMD